MKIHKKLSRIQLNIVKRVHIFLFPLTTLIEMWIINQTPLNRYPNWDLFWIDTMNTSGLFDLKTHLTSGSVPQIEFNSAFGTPNIIQPYYINPFNALNLILISPISPSQFILIKTFLFLVILQFGIFTILKVNYRDNLKALLLSLFATTIPLLWGMSYLSLAIFPFTCSLPYLYFFLTKFIREGNKRYLFALVIIINIVGLDLSTSILLATFTLAVILSEANKITSRMQYLKRILHVCAIVFTSISLFGFIFLHEYIATASQIVHTSLKKSEVISFSPYINFLIKNGMHTILYPIEGSALLLYLPISIYLILGYFYFTKKKNFQNIIDTNFEIRRIISCSLLFMTIPIIPYLFPVTAEMAPSYFRFQFNMAVILLYIAFSKIIVSEKLEIRLLKKILFLSLIFDVMLFLINPFRLFKNLNGTSYSIYSILGLNDHIYSSQLNNSFRGPLFFWEEKPWLNLVAYNFVFLFLLIILLKKQIVSNYLSIGSVFLIICLTFSSNLELRRYMNMWQQTSSDEYRISNFKNSFVKWVNQFDLSDPNYRILVVGRENYQGQGRNIKLVAITELNNIYDTNVLFQYREVNSFENRIREARLLCKECEVLNLNFANSPAIAKTVPNKINWLEDSSVKYVISADEEISSSRLVLLDNYEFKAKFGYDNFESGHLYLYEFTNPHPIVKGIGQKQDATIISTGLNTIIINPNENLAGMITVNYNYSPNFSAKQGQNLVKIFKNNDGNISLTAANLYNPIILKYSDPFYIYAPAYYCLFLFMYFLPKRYYNFKSFTKYVKHNQRV